MVRRVLLTPEMAIEAPRETAMIQPMSRHAAQSADTPALRRRAKQAIDQLSGGPLRLAADFLMYIEERAPETDAATRERLDIPGLTESVARGKRDASAGRVKDWRKVRKDV